MKAVFLLEKTINAINGLYRSVTAEEEDEPKRDFGVLERRRILEWLSGMNFYGTIRPIRRIGLALADPEAQCSWSSLAVYDERRYCMLIPAVVAPEGETSQDRAINGLEQGIRLWQSEDGLDLLAMGGGRRHVGIAERLLSALARDGDPALLKAAKKQSPLEPVADESKILDVLGEIDDGSVSLLAGLILGAAASRVPIVLDDFSTAVAAWIAKTLASKSRDFLLASYESDHPRHGRLLHLLKLVPLLRVGCEDLPGLGALLGAEVLSSLALTASCNGVSSAP